MNKLFAVYLGGKCEGAKIEVHDIVFTTGADIKATFPKLISAFFGKKSSAHVDSWIELDQVDGYSVKLNPKTKSQTKGPKLYFVNVGYYMRDVFGEAHNFLFVVSNSKDEAKLRAKKSFSKAHQLSHIDNLLEIDDLIELSEVDGYSISLSKAKTQSELKINNVYWPLSRKI